MQKQMDYHILFAFHQISPSLRFSNVASSILSFKVRLLGDTKNVEREGGGGIIWYDAWYHNWKRLSSIGPDFRTRF